MKKIKDEKHIKIKDSIGTVLIPRNKYWGTQTQRSIQFFNIGRENIPLEFIKSYSIIKKSSAMANYTLGLISKEKKDIIIKVCEEILKEQLNEHFPLKIWQTGSGTHTNMNLNEVISHRSNILSKQQGKNIFIHPNDDVNMSQSSNDTFPSAIHITSLIKLENFLLPNLIKLTKYFSQKEKDFSNIIKIGRTHLQDAVPMTLGQEFSGYKNQIQKNIQNINIAKKNLYNLAIGGTAIGTGLNAEKNFANICINNIKQITNLPFKKTENYFSSLSSNDDIVIFSNSLKSLSTSLIKIANDIRWLSSGPRCGIGELSIPSNEPGSSIMPGKINPTQCEALIMVCMQVIANDYSISFANTQGNFELNVCRPMIMYNIIQSLQILSDSCRSFGEYCIKNIIPNKKNIDFYVKNSLMLVTALNKKLGYDKSSKIAHLAFQENITLKESCLKLDMLSDKEFDAIVDPKKMI